MKARRSCFATVLSLLLFCFALAGGTVPIAELSADRYMQHVSHLASDELKGRGNGSPELERAAEYIASQFREFGLRPVGDNGTYFQEFQLTVGSEFGPDNALRIAETSRQHDTDFVTMPVSSSGSYEGPLVFAGYGITSPDLQWDDYDGIDVTGKAVVVFRHDPEERNPQGRFAQAQGAPTTFIAKAQNARRHGARAILFITDPNNHPNENDTVGPATSGLEARDLSILAMHVTRASVAPLFEAAGRSLADLQREIDTNRKPQSFELPGSPIRIAADVRPVRKTVRNVLAAVEGSDPVLRSEWLVIGAHYDHLGLGDSNSLAPSEIGQIHHGADDNASGTAGMLELARLAQRHRDSFKRSLLFMAFAGEELGLFGSSHFVSEPTVPFESISAMINMDMIGRLATRQLNVMGTGTSPNFETWVSEANEDIGLTLSLSDGGHAGSDHISFNGKRIPSLFFFSGLHADYHRPSDTAEKIDANGAIRILSIVAGVAERIAAAPAKPLYTEVRDTTPPGAASGGGSPYGTYFGSVPDFRDDLGGVLFADVRADSPAAKAGLKPGDLLVEMGGDPIKNLYDFTDALASRKPGDVVSVVVQRNGKAIKANVTLEVRR